jgi:hypothetical protein
VNTERAVAARVQKNDCAAVAPRPSVSGVYFSILPLCLLLSFPDAAEETPSHSDPEAISSSASAQSCFKKLRQPQTPGSFQARTNVI